jgi:hypothetical protein
VAVPAAVVFKEALDALRSNRRQAEAARVLVAAEMAPVSANEGAN